MPYSHGFASRYKVANYGERSGFPDFERGTLFDARPYVLLGAHQEGKHQLEPDLEGGLDVKIPITSSLTADLTINPDFSDAEADEQTDDVVAGEGGNPAFLGAKKTQSAERR